MPKGVIFEVFVKNLTFLLAYLNSFHQKPPPKNWGLLRVHLKRPQFSQATPGEER